MVIYALNDLIYVMVMLFVGYDVEFEGPRILGHHRKNMK